MRRAFYVRFRVQMSFGLGFAVRMFDRGYVFVGPLTIEFGLDY